MKQGSKTNSNYHCLITGGAGFIGSHLSEELLLRGNQVTIIDNLSTGRFENIEHLLHYPNFNFSIETITNEIVMDRLVSECDIIFHLAAAVGVEKIISDPVGVIETNILGTEKVLKVANRYKKLTLLASTSEIYGKNDNVPFDEESDRILGPTTHSRWSYSCSKAVDEFLALAYHKQKQLPIVILRFFNIIGPRQTGRYGMVVPRFIEQSLKNKPITVFGDGLQTRTFLDVRDAVQAVSELAFCEEAVGQIFNIGGTQEITIQKLAEKIKRMTSSSSKIQCIPYDQAYEYGFEDMRRRLPMIARLRNVIGFQPKYSLDDTLKSIIEAFSSQK
jgi:UDP-glucose 4-epimerase